jgi:mono/diheme cytochrome c family protein
MRGRASLLVMTIGVAIVAVACGRASQKEIDQALDITPTATLSPDDIATSTARAVAQASARAAAAAGSPGAVAALGDAIEGERQFGRWCMQCHRPDGSGRAQSLAGPSSGAAALSDAQIADLIRNGTNHTPPGPYRDFQITNQRVADIIAYLRSIGS